MFLEAESLHFPLFFPILFPFEFSEKCPQFPAQSKEYTTHDTAQISLAARITKTKLNLGTFSLFLCPFPRSFYPKKRAAGKKQSIFISGGAPDLNEEFLEGMNGEKD